MRIQKFKFLVSLLNPFLAVLLVAVACYSIFSEPIGWIEGWNLRVARTWAEFGVFGEPNGAGFGPVAFAESATAIAPIALSFFVLGVGLVQARLAALLCFLGATLCWWFLLRKLFSRKTATCFLLLLLVVSGQAALYSPTAGVLAHAHSLMLCALAFGYVSLVRGLRLIDRRWLIAASISFGVAIAALPSFWPVLLFAQIVPVTIAFITKQKRLPGDILAVLGGAAAVAIVGIAAEQLISLGAPDVRAGSIGFVASAEPRSSGLVEVLQNAAQHGFAPLVALCCCSVLFVAGPRWRKLDRAASVEAGQRLSLCLVCFGALVHACFVARQGLGGLYPMIAVGLLLFSSALSLLTGDFSLRVCLQRLRISFGDTDSDDRGTGEPIERRARLTATASTATLVIVLLGLLQELPRVASHLARQQPLKSYLAVSDTADWLAARLRPGSVVETTESDLLFLLPGNYHYPPGGIPAAYDPLVAKPEFLVVGPFATAEGWYQDAIRSAKFRRVQTFGPYEIYRRVRS